MADTTPTQPMRPSSPPLGDDASAASCFADSAIMDMSTLPSSPTPKPAFESDHLELGTDTPSDLATEKIPERLQRLVSLAAPDRDPHITDHDIDNVHDHLDHIEDILDPSSNLASGKNSPDSPTDLEYTAATDSDLVSHLSTTVSSLRLRHQEQSHLHTLFTSKLEALAEKSLEQEAKMSSLTAELRSLRKVKTNLSHDNSLLAQQNHELKGEIADHETAMNAMTGAVRGLEGWIQSTTARSTPRSNSPATPSLPLRDRPPRPQEQQDQKQSRGAREIVRGKGRFRGKYYVRGDNDNLTTIYDQDPRPHTIHQNDFPTEDSTATVAPTSPTTAETIEGVMAWLRGFKDVEDGAKARRNHYNGSSNDRHIIYERRNGAVDAQQQQSSNGRSLDRLETDDTTTMATTMMVDATDDDDNDDTAAGTTLDKTVTTTTTDSSLGLENHGEGFGDFEEVNAVD